LRELLHQRELPGLQPRVNHLDNVQESLLLGFVVSLARHLDVGDRGRFSQRRRHFAVVAQPCFQISDRRHGVELGREPIENRRELRGVGQVDGFRKKLARDKMRRVHGFSMPQERRR
jgi:hypothetical protein